MSAAGRWFVTPHAVERYRERHRPDISRAQALRELVLWSEVATQTCRMRTGDYEWTAEEPRKIRFVVTYYSEGDLPALKTVLPGGRVGWIDLVYDVQREFDGLQVTQFAEVPILDRESNSRRRAAYAVARQEAASGYEAHLARARQRSAAKDERERAETNRRERERHRLARSERLEGRPCRRCGAPVPARKGSGTTPVYCSVVCNRRAASLAYWRRKQARR